jgi:hypothetical protein
MKSSRFGSMGSGFGGAAQNRSRAANPPADGHYRVNEKDVIDCDKVTFEDWEVLGRKKIKHGMTVAPDEHRAGISNKSTTLAYGNVLASAPQGLFFCRPDHVPETTSSMSHILRGCQAHPLAPAEGVTGFRGRRVRSARHSGRCRDNRESGLLPMTSTRTPCWNAADFSFALSIQASIVSACAGNTGRRSDNR